MLALFGLGRKPPPPMLKTKMPAVNSFVALMMAGGGPRGSVCVETIGSRSFVVSALSGLKTGGTGVFSYENESGRFRFSSRCLDVRSAAVFALPDRIETLETFAGARSRTAVRLDATVPAQWRFAPGGRGSGDWTRASLTDVSRSGASLIADRDVKRTVQLEIKFTISTRPTPLVLVAEVMRSEPIESTEEELVGRALPKRQARRGSSDHGIHQQAASRTATPRLGLRSTYRK